MSKYGERHVSNVAETTYIKANRSFVDVGKNGEEHAIWFDGKPEKERNPHPWQEKWGWSK